MEIRLEKATEIDAETIFNMQVESFKPLLETYRDYKTNPASEKIERTIARINNPYGGYYKILVNHTLTGAICVYRKKETMQYWISPMFILPNYQGNVTAQKVLVLIEKMFPEATSWEFATILEDERNCYLYEKIGYMQTGLKKQLNENATLVYYKKA
ncbi:hypothetical protein [Bacillus clarus]|uniref:Acetyltransferase, GNAT family n=1 Tax=Bacillus clarus TaxID=2338372 RepID=A0A090YRC9_9BACI|nr:hypothetical protein [Bacillus clarus]KFN00980.1 acetyltransferase, GNAT family [Bacillus clarus]